MLAFDKVPYRNLAMANGNDVAPPIPCALGQFNLVAELIEEERDEFLELSMMNAAQKLGMLN